MKEINDNVELMIREIKIAVSEIAPSATLKIGYDFSSNIDSIRVEVVPSQK